VTTPEFLQFLGLNSIQDMPPVEAPEAGMAHDEVLKG
jgi:chromosome segregation and condensation protein ScpB